MRTKKPEPRKTQNAQIKEKYLSCQNGILQNDLCHNIRNIIKLTSNNTHILRYA